MLDLILYTLAWLGLCGAVTLALCLLFTLAQRADAASDDFESRLMDGDEYVVPPSFHNGSDTL